MVDNPTPASVLAVFDFDNTLVRGDSLWPFVVAVVGLPAAVAAMAEGIARAAVADADVDKRTRIKEVFLRRTLARQTPAAILHTAARIHHWPRWKAPIMARLHAHYQSGHHVVIASGGLDLYLPSLLSDIPYHALICTKMASKADGSLTGEMLSPNCVRANKAALVKQYIDDYEIRHTAFADSWGYGNLPHDLPMLALVKNRVIV